MKLRITPPQLFLRFFRWYCNPGMLDYIEGDLLEEYSKRLKATSKRKADIKFMIDVLLLLRPAIIKPGKKNHHLNSYDMLSNYFKIGWRNLWRSKGYSLINIGGLAMGITVTMLIGLWVYDELSYDKYNPNYARVAQVIQNVTNNGEVQTWDGVPFPLAEELRANYGSDFKLIVMAVERHEHLLSVQDKIVKQKGGYFENGAPALLGLKTLRGSSNFLDPASILLSASAAQAFFGDDEAINKVVKIDDMPLVKVIGVYEDLPNNSQFAGLNFIATWDFYYSNTPWLKTFSEPWRPNFVSLFVVLKDYADFSRASAKIKDAKIKKVSDADKKKKPELFLSPMSRWHLYSEYKNGVNVGGAIQNVWMLGIIGAFVLLLACINFMNLSTARNEKRAKEVGIRKTIGSLQRQLIFQFFSEAFMTVTIAFTFAIMLAQLTLPLFNTLAAKQMIILWGSPWLWFVSTGFIFLTSLIAGSYPAFYLSSFKPIKVLKGTFKTGRFAALPRKVLVTAQFTISLTLIIGTIIIYEQIRFAENRPVGYSRNNLVSVTTRNSAIHDHFEAVKRELTQAGVIRSMAESEGPLTAIWSSTSGLTWPGKDPSMSIDFGFVYASSDYGKTIDWKIKEGRDFSAEFASDSSGIILNEAAIRIMNIKDPVGQQLSWFGQPCTVIGVVHDMVMASAYEDVKPIIYGNLTGAGRLALIKLNPSISAHEAMDKIEHVFKRLDAEHPFEYQFVDQEYATKFGNERRIGKLSSIFAALAIFISCLGLFGLSSFVAEQRTKEIGVRKVMGASVFSLWRMLSKDFLSLVIVAIIISIPAAYYFMHGWLMKYQYRTEISGWVFVIAGSGALMITLLTVSYQTIKAALINPVSSLRSE